MNVSLWVRTGKSLEAVADRRRQEELSQKKEGCEGTQCHKRSLGLVSAHNRGSHGREGKGVASFLLRFHQASFPECSIGIRLPNSCIFLGIH